LWDFACVSGDGRCDGVLQRVELADRTLILSADNPDESRSPIRTFDIKGKSLPDILISESSGSAGTWGAASDDRPSRKTRALPFLLASLGQQRRWDKSARQVLVELDLHRLT
jgi:hypothetical protein